MGKHPLSFCLVALGSIVGQLGHSWYTVPVDILLVVLGSNLGL